TRRIGWPTAVLVPGRRVGDDLPGRVFRFVHPSGRLLRVIAGDAQPLAVSDVGTSAVVPGAYVIDVADRRVAPRCATRSVASLDEAPLRRSEQSPPRFHPGKLVVARRAVQPSKPA